jgi:hypothetical protein
MLKSGLYCSIKLDFAWEAWGIGWISGRAWEAGEMYGRDRARGKCVSESYPIKSVHSLVLKDRVHEDIIVLEYSFLC